MSGYDEGRFLDDIDRFHEYRDEVDYNIARSDLFENYADKLKESIAKMISEFDDVPDELSPVRNSIRSLGDKIEELDSVITSVISDKKLNIEARDKFVESDSSDIKNSAIDDEEAREKLKEELDTRVQTSKTIHEEVSNILIGVREKINNFSIEYKNLSQLLEDGGIDDNIPKQEEVVKEPIYQVISRDDDLSGFNIPSNDYDNEQTREIIKQMKIQSQPSLDRGFDGDLNVTVDGSELLDRDTDKIRSEINSNHDDYFLKLLLNINRNIENVAKNTEKDENESNQRPSSDNETSTGRKRKRKEPSWVSFFLRGVGGIVKPLSKGTTRTITMLLRPITGFLKGILTTSMLGVAKTGAILALFVYAFDWIQVILNTWKHEMLENYDEFMSENGHFGVFKRKAVELSETIKNFFDKDYQSEFLSNAESKLTDVIQSLLGTVLSGVMGVVTYMADSVVAMFKNALKIGGTDHTAESVALERIQRYGDVKDTHINEYNYNNVIMAREHKAMREASSNLSTFEKLDRRNELSFLEEPFDPTNKLLSASGHSNVRKVKKQFRDDLMSRGYSEEDAIRISDDSKNLANYARSNIDILKDLSNEFGDDTGKFLEIMSKSSSKALREFGPQAIEKYREIMDKHSIFDFEMSERDVMNTLLNNRGENLAPIDQKRIERSMDSMNLKYGYTNLEVRKPIVDMTGRLEHIDNDSIKLNRSLETSNFRRKMLSNQLITDSLEKVLEKKVGETNSVLINNQNNSYNSGTTPIGGIPSFSSNGSNFKYS